MREWVHVKADVLHTLFDMENPNPTGGLSDCSCGHPSELRCHTCLGRPLYCRECCLTVHALNPFHDIREYNKAGLPTRDEVGSSDDGFYKPITIKDLGYVLDIGHNGRPCPQNSNIKHWFATSAAYDQLLVVVDVSGVYDVPIRWCQCKGQTDKSLRYHLLLRMGLYPTSTTNPKTVFTFQCLDHFHMDIMECNTPASAFYSKLRRLTDDWDSDVVKVPLLPLTLSRY